MAELHVLTGESVSHIRAIGADPVHLGRAPTNDLVLTDKQISARHAVIWSDGGSLRVEDLGSRNGTFVNDRPVGEKAEPVRDGDVLRLGSVRIRVVEGEAGRARGALLVEDAAAGVSWPIRGDRFRIGSGPEADLRLPEGSGVEATLVLHDNGEIWLGTDDEDRAVEIGAPFTLAGRALRLRESSDAVSRTEATEVTRYAYRLRARLDGGAGPEASVEDLRSGRIYRVDTENRATLLYLLARQYAKDADRSDSDRGWCADDEIATGVWGRDKNRFEPNNYHVLVCRLRKELREAGFDAYFIEKRRKYIRVRLDQVVVEG